MMAKTHGKNMVVTVGGVSIISVQNSEIERTAATEATGGYGIDSMEYSAGLLNGTFTMDGTYDSTATTGPRAALNGLIGTAVTIIRQPEGAGAGLPQDSFSAILTSYKETAPYDGQIMWTSSWQITGDVNSAAQSA